MVRCGIKTLQGDDYDHKTEKSSCNFWQPFQLGLHVCALPRGSHVSDDIMKRRSNLFANFYPLPSDLMWERLYFFPSMRVQLFYLCWLWEMGVVFLGDSDNSKRRQVVTWQCLSPRILTCSVFGKHFKIAPRPIPPCLHSLSIGGLSLIQDKDKQMLSLSKIWQWSTHRWWTCWRWCRRQPLEGLCQAGRRRAC